MPNEAEVSIHLDEVSKIVNLGLLALLPLFTGDEKGPSAKEFFQQIKETVIIAGWENKFTLLAFRSKCRVLAQEFLRNHPEVGEEKSFKNFKKVIIQRVQPEEPKLIKLQNFFQAKQKDKETAIEFISRIKTLGRAIVDEKPSVDQIATRDSLIQAQIVKGINPKIKGLFFPEIQLTWKKPLSV